MIQSHEFAPQGPDGDSEYCAVCGLYCDSPPHRGEESQYVVRVTAPAAPAVSGPDIPALRAERGGCEAAHPGYPEVGCPDCFPEER